MNMIKQAHMAGKQTSDNVIDMLAQSAHSVRSGKYVAPNPMNIEVFNPYDDRKFTQATWGGQKLQQIEDRVPIMVNGKPTGQYRVVTNEIVTPDIQLSVGSSAKSYYDTDSGTAKHFNQLLNDKEFVNSVNPVFKSIYGRDIQNGGDLASAYALAQKQGGMTKAGASKYDELYMEGIREDNRLRNIAANKSAQQQTQPTGNLFDAFGEGRPLEIPGKGVDVTNGVWSDKAGNPYSGTLFMPKELVPVNLYNALKSSGVDDKILRGNEGFNVKIKDGRIQSLSDPNIGTIDRQGMQDAQLKWNTEPQKSRQPSFTSKPSPASAPSSSKQEKTWAQKQAEKTGKK